jgi:hypothetical protein
MNQLTIAGDNLERDSALMLVCVGLDTYKYQVNYSH